MNWKPQSEATVCGLECVFFLYRHSREHNQGGLFGLMHLDSTKIITGCLDKKVQFVLFNFLLRYHFKTPRCQFNQT